MGRVRKGASNETSQSALEYSITYGWVILIIVIILAALYSFGIFNPTIPAVYTGLAGFQVTGQDCVSNFGFFVDVGNQLGSYVQITGVNVTSSNGVNIASLPLSITLAPAGQQIFSIPGACPFQPGSTYNIIMTISYKIVSAIFGNGRTTGNLAGTVTAEPTSLISSLVSNSFAFGTSNGNLSLTSEYYSSGIFLGKLSSPFPDNLSDLQGAFLDCSAPYNSQGYTAISYMYFSPQVSFKIITNDATEVFYKSLSGGNWKYIFNYSGTPSSGPWAGHSNSLFSNLINVTAGEYEVAVDWMNICGGGISALSVNGAISPNSRWNVTVWDPFNSSVDILPYASINASPALPKNISVEQTGFWNSSTTVNSCGSNQLCTTIFNDFGLPAGYSWWLDYDNINTSSTSTFTSFITQSGNFSYSLKPFNTKEKFCVLYYSGAAVSGYLSAGQSAPYTTTSLSENCSIGFNEIGLPSGNKWNITVNKVNKTASSPNNITTYPSAQFSPFKARQITVGANTYYPCPTSGNISSGAYVTINYSTTNHCSPTNYLISTIYQTNLPQFINWTATYNTLSKFSNITQAVSFLTTSGNYSFDIKPIIVDYKTTGCIGNFSANKSSGYIIAGNIKTVSFSQKLNCSTVFQEYGLPKGLSNWNITYNSSTHVSSMLPSNISFYALTSAPNNVEESISLPTPGYASFKAYTQILSGTKYYPCPATGELASGNVETIVYSNSSSCPYV